MKSKAVTHKAKYCCYILRNAVVSTRERAFFHNHSLPCLYRRSITLEEKRKNVKHEAYIFFNSFAFNYVLFI